jgi:hypothetical protein
VGRGGVLLRGKDRCAVEAEREELYQMGTPIKEGKFWKMEN